MTKKIITTLAILSLSCNAQANDTLALDDVIVRANRFENKDTDTTYASEIHTAKQIENSGAATLYDYLAQQTSLNILSSFGNKATPSINLRGYGSANGSQNVVITVDGQRLNNIDSQPQLLGAIPLNNIERIEISKGSGSVVYGDGATAGAIQIYTKNKTGVTASTSFGNYGQKNHYLNAGFSEQYIDLSASLSHDSHDGFSDKDKTGHKDAFTSDTQNVKLKIKPTDSLRLITEATSSRNNLRYPNSLTKAQFDDDPSQNGRAARAYTQQKLSSDQWRVGAEYDITKELKISATHYQDDKKSAYPSFVANYDYRSNDIALSFNNESISAMVGYQDFDGDRITDTDTTTKNNKAVFVQTEYRPGWFTEALTLSAGYRNEKVNYEYQPTSGSQLAKTKNLNAWDIGVNYRFGPRLTAFANYNHAFLAPDIDKFFGYDPIDYSIIFNGFISPEKSNTANIGINHVTSNNHLKLTVFHVDLDDEIYYNISTFTDTNIDKSHKYGLEIQDHFKFNDKVSTSLIYNYTRAIIDRESDGAGAGAFNGKDLPGVPKHTVVANLNYKFFDHAMFNLSHTWRSQAYAANDFGNNFSQKQENYQSTNVAVSYQYENLQFLAAINNLLEHENSIQIRNDAIYPVDFVRTWRVAVKADF